MKPDATTLIILWLVVLSGWIYIFVKLHKILKGENANEKDTPKNNVSHM